MNGSPARPIPLARFLLTIIVALFVTGCGEVASDKYRVEDKPYTMTAGADGLNRIVLEASAARRLGIETQSVVERGSSLVIPIDAVLVDSHGDFWVYTSPRPLEFVRLKIVIFDETSTEALLSEGPSAGTQVVTVGVPELYGIDARFDA